MKSKPTYEELEKKVEALEKALAQEELSEQALRASEEKFSKAFRANPSMMAMSTLVRRR